LNGGARDDLLLRGTRADQFRIGQDGSGDFFGIGCGIGPSVDQIGSGNVGIILQELGFPDAKLLGFDQEPNGNAGSGNTGFAATNTGHFGNTLTANAQGLD
jgi:hypothetical protein